MDSLTQATLGAAVAAAGWHRPLGRKALAWGAALGTLPDLDVVVFPWLDTVQRLYWHRGESHSLFLIIPMALAAGWLVQRAHRGSGLSFARAAFVTWLVFLTHVLIDFFTVYGTQLLAPFSRHGFGSNNLFIIDPLYTVPLLLGCLLFAVWPAGAGRRANVAGLVVSTVYVVWSFGAQAAAERGFQRELARQGIVATGPALTAATPLNTVLWRHLAPVEGGFMIGYRSLLDADEAVRFDFVPQRAELAAPWRGAREFEVLEWFSQGFWIAQPGTEGTRIIDLRFGEIRTRPGVPPDEWGHVFAWELAQSDDGRVELRQLPQAFGDRRAALGAVWRRLRGDRAAW
jgi:inner membrane protein